MNNYITRTLSKQIGSNLFKGRAIMLYGPRQAGKTTLLKNLISKYDKKTIWLNADNPDVREELTNVTLAKWRKIVGKKKVVVIDEAQRVNNIGLSLKIALDEIKDIQIIATGSSSFELMSEITEPLTGRKYEYKLLPFSFSELVDNSDYITEKQSIESRLLFGSYPSVITNPGEEQLILSELTNSYLFKDIFAIDGIKKASVFDKLVKALALQIGSEVSYTELASLVSIDRKTVEKYIDLLEKCFVVFSLPAFSGNMRNEIKKGRKIYFYDLGIRNSIIGNFTSLSARQDVGNMWENYLISERIKKNLNKPFPSNSYFWRIIGKQNTEIDYIENSPNKLCAWEIKWNRASKAKIPLAFKNAYSEAETQILTPSNYDEFLL